MIERPFFILLLLTALNFLNYVDRYLVAAVAPKYQEALSLSNTMTGFVASAFMIGYFVTSPIFGRLADGRSANSTNLRTKLIFVGVILWSIATVASGMATGAGSLIAARVCVGVGEASYATIAPTIIDDLAPPEKKNKWLAVFYLAIPVGSALGYVLGGFLEHRYGWRSAFYVAGGPGVLLAFLVLLIREPARGAISESISSGAGLRALRRAPLYLACVGGLCMYTFALGGFAVWAPKFLYQTHKMELADADFGFGTVAVLGGIVGTVVGGFLADRGVPEDASNERRLRAYLRFSAIATALAVPASIATIFAPSPRAFFLAIFVCEAALFASTSPINAVILGSVPSWMRATAMAVSIFAIHAFGDFPSPPLVGKIADHTTLRNALLILPVAIAVCAITWWWGVRLRIVDGDAESQPI
jgi:MFS family permease